MTDAPDYASRERRRQGANSPQSVADIARAYVARGWKVIPIPHGEKGCKDRNWPTKIYDPDHDFNGAKNIGVQLGPVSGGLTDIDLDTQEAIKLASAFLPATDATFGRKSKSSSHWLYLIDDPEAASTIKLVNEQKETIVELRLGGGGKAALTVFPGSVHQSGEKVEWVKTGEPAKSTFAVLNVAITKIAVATLLARHWPAAGNRHEAAMRCGGFLARAGWTPEAIQEFMRPVQEVAGVANDVHIRGGCSAAFDAATHVLNDGKGYGFPALLEFFGEEVTKQVAKILHYRERDLDAELERMNEKYCIMPFGGKVRVLAFERELNRSVLTFYSAADFQLLHNNVSVPVGGDEFKGLGTWWLYHRLRRQYEGLVFAPGSPRVIDGRLLNLWQGWGIAPRKGSWKQLRKHIFKVLANGDKKNAKYIIKWTAWTFQHPDQRAETALVLQGGQGVGKGLWCRLLCKIFGQHGIHISSHNQLTGKHNKHLLDCALLFADEAFWPGDKSSEGTLKRIVTEDTLMIEPKFFDATMNANRLHIIIVSNKTWVVPADIDDRRFAVFNVSKQYQNDKDYFEPLYQEIENGGGAAMLHDLLHMQLGNWHPRYNVPKTLALREQKELSLSAEDQWWYELLKTGLLPRGRYANHANDTYVAGNAAYDPRRANATATNNPRRARSRDLFDAARKTVPGLRYHSDHLLGKALRQRGCLQCQLAKRAGWEFPDLTEARAAWDAKLPGTEWNDEVEWGDDDPM